MKTQEDYIKEFIATFDEKEKQGYEIAKSHLGSSFDLAKSHGYLQWLKTQQVSDPPLNK